MAPGPVCSRNSGALSPDPDMSLQPNFLETMEGNKKETSFKKYKMHFETFNWSQG